MGRADGEEMERGWRTLLPARRRRSQPATLQRAAAGAAATAATTHQRHEAVVLLVHVHVLDGVAGQEAVVPAQPANELGHVCALQARCARPPVHDDERPADAAAVRRDVHRLVPLVHVAGAELADQPVPPQGAQARRKVVRGTMHAEDKAVQEHDEGARCVQLVARQRAAVLHAQVEAQLPQRGWVLVRRHVREQRQILHQAARLSLWRV